MSPVTRHLKTDKPTTKKLQAGWLIGLTFAAAFVGTYAVGLVRHVWYRY